VGSLWARIRSGPPLGGWAISCPPGLPARCELKARSSPLIPTGVPAGNPLRARAGSSEALGWPIWPATSIAALPSGDERASGGLRGGVPSRALIVPRCASSMLSASSSPGRSPEDQVRVPDDPPSAKGAPDRSRSSQMRPFRPGSGPSPPCARRPCRAPLPHRGRGAERLLGIDVGVAGPRPVRCCDAGSAPGASPRGPGRPKRRRIAPPPASPAAVRSRRSSRRRTQRAR
jgi:hypothetical protein